MSKLLTWEWQSTRFTSITHFLSSSLSSPLRTSEASFLFSQGVLTVSQLLRMDAKLAALSLDPKYIASTASVHVQDSLLERPLCTLFQEGQALVERLTHEGGPSNPSPSPLDASARAGNDDIRQGLTLFNEISRRVHSLGLLSSNEELDDVATADLKYVLVDFYLGILHSQVPLEGEKGDMGKRQIGIGKALTSFETYMQRCEQLGLLKGEDQQAWAGARAEEEEEGSADGHDDDQRRRAVLPTKGIGVSSGNMNVQRTQKIERFRKLKTARERLRVLNHLLVKVKDSTKEAGAGEQGKNREEPSGEEEELERERSKLWIKMGVWKVLDEWTMLKQEQEILAMMRTQGGERRKEEKGTQGSSARGGVQVTHIDKTGPGGQLRIRQEDLRARVFQPGYTLPTVSLEEFAAQELAAAQERKAKEERRAGNLSEPRRYAQLEEEGKEDDARLVEEAAYQDRTWDDWKDAHPRGSGNKLGKRF